MTRNYNLSQEIVSRQLSEIYLDFKTPHLIWNIQKILRIVIHHTNVVH